MIKVEAILRPDKIESVVEKLKEIGVAGITKTEVEGHGKQKGILEQFRGKEYRLTFIPKVKLEMIVKDIQSDSVVKAIINICQTGQIGDGKIFLSEIKDVIRVRTGENGEKAI